MTDESNFIALVSLLIAIISLAVAWFALVVANRAASNAVRPEVVITDIDFFGARERDVDCYVVIHKFRNIGFGPARDVRLIPRGKKPVLPYSTLYLGVGEEHVTNESGNPLEGYAVPAWFDPDPVDEEVGLVEVGIEYRDVEGHLHHRVCEFALRSGWSPDGDEFGEVEAVIKKQTDPTIETTGSRFREWWQAYQAMLDRKYE